MYESQMRAGSSGACVARTPLLLCLLWLAAQVPAALATRATAAPSASATDDEAANDWHFPREEPGEMSSAQPIWISELDSHSGTVSISLAAAAAPGGAPPRTHRLALGETAFNWTLRSVIPPASSAGTSGAPETAIAVLERNWARWGALLYLQEAGAGGSSAWQPCRLAPRNPCLYLRKGVGRVDQIKRPRYNLMQRDSDYFVKATTSTDDWLKQRFTNSTSDGEPTFVSAASALPPTPDYVLVKNVAAHSGFSISPQGRVMSANFSIREQMERGKDTPQSPGGLVLFDPRSRLPFSWPETNFSDMKSAMLGRFSRAVTVGVFDAALRKGFSLLATPNPQRGIMTQPYDRAELLVRIEAASAHEEEEEEDAAAAEEQNYNVAATAAAPMYFAVEACSLCETAGTKVSGVNCSEVVPAARCGSNPQLVRELSDPSEFYSILLEHCLEWQQFHLGVNNATTTTAKSGGRRQTASGGSFDVQIAGHPEGTRVVDTARSVIAAGMSNFIGLRPNYGSGSVYWSVAELDRGALPLQSFALNRALLLWGHHREAALRLEYLLRSMLV
jgi:hypothetical protein